MAEPIRVLHLVNQLTVGGSERQMLMLIRALDPAQIESSVGYMRLGTGELLKPLAALGTSPEQYSLRGSLAQLNTVTQIRRLAARCRQQAIALIHAHDLWANIIGFAAARLASIPILISRRDMADFRPLTERRLLRLVGRLANATIVNAAAIGKLAVAEGARAEVVHVIPNGIDLAAFDREMAAPLSAPLPARIDGFKRIAVIGNMDRPQKGHADALVAASKLRELPLDWLFVSDGPLRTQFERRATELGVSERVHFVGRRRDVPALLKHVDMLVHPSHSEGFPNVVLEALSARLTVVATSVGATSDLIADHATGRLVSPQSAEALATAVADCMNDWDRATRWADAGREAVGRNFTSQTTAARFAKLYSQLADGSSKIIGFERKTPHRAVTASQRRSDGSRRLARS